jgi:hypothetical protein
MAIALLSGAIAGCESTSNPVSGDDGGSSAVDATAAELGTAEGAASEHQDGPQVPTADPVASFSATAINLTVPCGTSATSRVMVSNTGPSPLSVSATAVGSAFSVNPSSVTVGPQGSANMTVTATVPTTALAGVTLMGALNLFSNDPAKTMVSIPLSAMPTGATLAFTTGNPMTLTFPATAIGGQSSLNLNLQNVGNGPAMFTLGPLSDSRFAVGGADAGLPSANLSAGAIWPLTLTFSPTDATSVSAMAAITATGGLCGASVSSLSFQGQGATGQIANWPSVVDFGPATCGGDPPAEQSFTVSNKGAVDAHVTSVTLDATSGFTTNVRQGKVIPAGGLLRVTVDAPPVPANAPSTSAISTKLTIATDSDPNGTPNSITLQEEPSGAVLVFDPPAQFGSFGTVNLLQSATQNFGVKNTGTAPADVKLLMVLPGGSDAGASSSPDAGAVDAADASDEAGAPTGPFMISVPSFPLAGGSEQADSVVFSPLAAGLTTGSIVMTTTTPICGALPTPLSVSGSGMGGGISVTPSSLSFSATCGGAAPASQTVTIKNDGTADLTWDMSAPTGPGAAQYTVSALPAPGLLIPGASAMITVTAAKVPTPVANPDPSAFAAQIAITTDVPLDPIHVVTLGETPLGDQISFTTPGPLRFGQIPINTTLSQMVTVSNSANVGTPAANLAFSLGGTGSAGYTAPAGIPSLAPGSSTSVSLVFSPTKGIAYPATLGITTNDSLCTALPAGLPLSGTGTMGQVSLSAATFAFGTDPSDPHGFVNCGATGLPQTLTVANVGNQAFQIKSLQLGKGASSPFSLPSSVVSSLPLAVPIGGNARITITPSPIPKTITTDPNDPTTYADTLTVVTDAAQDPPHLVYLVMQARGAIISNTPLQTNWSFGTVTAGSIQSFTSSIVNTGNAPVSVGLQGLLQPTIFGLQKNPTLAPGATTQGGSVVTAIVGQFTPPSPNGSWSDSGTLVVTAPQAFCVPLPTQWTNAAITMSGATNSNSSLTYAGSLTFPTTNCGDVAPAAQAITINNATDVTYPYTVQFTSGTYYSYSATTGPVVDGGLGVDAGGPHTITANGTATIVVTPTTIKPGAGVVPGSAPYADNLIVTVGTSPPTQWTIPIAWTLSGAVLSLPQGAGPYTADSTGAFTLPMVNTGTAPANVNFGIVPFGALQFSPAPPVTVGPGIGATPGLVASSSDAVCPATTTVMATFAYSGPVCQPFSVNQVSVGACFGTLP